MTKQSLLDAGAPPADVARAIARIVKVNHAGEYGAIRIYRSQIGVARWRCPDLVGALSEMLVHEVEHCAKFADAMPARAAVPCRALFLWSTGGWLLGASTALLGHNGVWACTAAVEAAVHHHLDDQLVFLAGRDQGLFDLIADIRAQEAAHLEHAETNLTSHGPSVRLLRAAIGAITNLLILASTSGDSARMASDIARARA